MLTYADVSAGGFDGSTAFQPAFASSLTMGRSREELRKSIDPSSFQTRSLGKGASSLSPPRRYYYPEQLASSSKPLVPLRDECIQKGRVLEKAAQDRLASIDWVSSNAAEAIAQGSNVLDKSFHNKPRYIQLSNAGTFASSIRKDSEPERIPGGDMRFLRARQGLGGGNLRGSSAYIFVIIGIT